MQILAEEFFMYFVQVADGRWLNLDLATEFIVVSQGHRTGPERGQGWVVQITVDQEVRRYTNERAFEIFQAFDDLTRPPGSSPGY
jgi:hypothetical protein